MALHVHPLLLACLLLSAPLASGCTLLGAIGSNASSKGAENVKPGAVETTDEGRRVTITLHDSTRIEGHFGGIRVENTDAYMSRYSEWKVRQADPQHFPDFLSSVTVNPDSGNSVEGIFIGFDFDRIYVRSRGHSPAWDLGHVRSVTDSTSDGAIVIPGAILFDQTTRGSVPLRSSYIVDSSASDSEVALDARRMASIVLHAEFRPGPLLVGMGADAVLVTLAWLISRNTVFGQ